MPSRILIIRLGALGDLTLCFRAFQAIRNAHPQAEIALLTMPAFAGFARQMPWFDRVLIDPRPSVSQPKQWLELIKAVRDFAPDRVYDLQGKFRQTILYTLLGGPFGPEWSGAAPLCSHPRLWPPKPDMSFSDFVAAQLERAGIAIPDQADTSWLNAPIDGLRPPERFVLFIPGCAPGRPYKRWPAASFAALADRLKQNQIGVVAIGTKDDAAAIGEIKKRAPYIVDLSGQTSLLQIGALARRAEGVVGNDTGPTHMAAAVGARTVALMSEFVDPVWSSPNGPHASWLQGKPLAALPVDRVFEELMRTK